MEASVAQLAPCGLVVLALDGTIVDANEFFVEWVGRDFMGRRLTDFLADERDSSDAARAWSDPATGPQGVRSLTVKLIQADGTPRPVLVSWRTEGDLILVVLFDATKREEFETQLNREQALAARQERRLNLLLTSAVAFANAVDEGALAQDLAAVAQDAYTATSADVLFVDEDGVITLAAGSTPFMAGIEGQPLGEAAMQLRTVTAVADIRKEPELPDEIVDVLTEAGMRAFLVAPIFHESRQLGLLAVFFDHVRPFDAEAAPLAAALTGQAGQVLARIELTKQLHRSAMLDEITGLPNRRLFEEQVYRTAQTDELVGVAFVDLDGFKAVNDRLGHDAGDRVLREVAVRIQSVVRERDSVARFGGDEFVAVCAVNDLRAAEKIAERIREAVAEPYDLPVDLSVSASVGLAVSRAHPDPEVADRLVRVADQAMYRAKTEGGNRVVVSVG